MSRTEPLVAYRATGAEVGRSKYRLLGAFSGVCVIGSSLRPGRVRDGNTVSNAVGDDRSG